MRTVHYLVRRPGASGQVVYPSELDEEENYYGYGAFFLAGNDLEDVDQIYGFWAIHDSRAIETKLERYSTNIFAVGMPRVGDFKFRARRVGVPVKYMGSFRGLTDRWLIRQLAPLDHGQLDAAVREHDFYFVGFTPILDTNR